MADFEEDEDGFAYCPLCGGPGFELGSLGNVRHFRCRDCGMNFSDDHKEAATITSWNSVMKQTAWTRLTPPSGSNWEVSDIELASSEELTNAILTSPDGEVIQVAFMHLDPAPLDMGEWFGDLEGEPVLVATAKDGRPEALYGEIPHRSELATLGMSEEDADAIYQGPVIPEEIKQIIQSNLVESNELANAVEERLIIEAEPDPDVYRY